MSDATHLKHARRLVAEAKERVLVQRERVVRLTATGQNRSLAENLLFAFERTLLEMRRCLAIEEQYFARLRVMHRRRRATHRRTPVKSSLGLIRIVRKLYAAQVNLAIESDGDGGFRVGISKRRYRLAATKHFPAKELPLIAEWLERTAHELYPLEYA